MNRSNPGSLVMFTILGLSTTTFALAQDPLGPDDRPRPAPVAPRDPGVPPGAGVAPDEMDEAGLSKRVSNLERELAEVKARARADARDVDDDDDDHDWAPWQLSLRGGWMHLAHSHRDEVLERNSKNNGWMIGIGLDMPLLLTHGSSDHDHHDRVVREDRDGDGRPETEVVHRDDHDDDDGILDLYGHMAIEYRQLRDDPHYRSPITGKRGTISYLNFTAAPKLCLDISEVARPFVLVGANMMIASAHDDALSHLDLGLVLGVGIDFRVTERLSFGVDYRYTWYGVADLEDEDYGQLAGYIGINF